MVIYIPTAFSVGYIFIFSIASLLHKKQHSLKNNTKQLHKFCIIYPAYAEDTVILDSINIFMNQSYPNDLFNVIVVSDHMKEDTNQKLLQFPLECIIANYENSSKAKALQLASKYIGNDNDYVVILDADNIVETDFLHSLNKKCKPNVIAYQCHRQAKNQNTPTAILDAASEEINNSIFRRGHNRLGIASALIGSGMCFERKWFVEHVSNLKTSGEDKELEAMLLAEGKYIEYIDDIPVYDEKTNNSKNFSKQRRRWMAAQYTSCAAMIANMNYNIGYIDKVIQQMILPRSLCIGITIVMLLTLHTWWILLFVALCVSLIIALPYKFWNINTLKAFSHLPMLTFRMGINLFKLKGQSNKFSHTTHIGS